MCYLKKCFIPIEPALNGCSSHYVPDFTWAKLLAKSPQSSSGMGVSGGRQCSGYIPKKAVCCFYVCPAAHSGSSLTPKGSFSPSQASQESESQPANTAARARYRKDAQTLPAETSSPKSSCTDRSEPTKASLETLRTLAMEKEQPWSTSSGCQQSRTGQCFPRVSGAKCDSQGRYCGHSAWHGGAGVRKYSAGEVRKHPSTWSYVAESLNSAHPSTLHSISTFQLPSCALDYPVFTYLGCYNPVTSFSKWQTTPGGTGSRISVRRALLWSFRMHSSPKAVTRHVLYSA